MKKFSSNEIVPNAHRLPDDKLTNTNSLCMEIWPMGNCTPPTTRNPFWWFHWPTMAKNWAKYFQKNVAHCMPRNQRHPLKCTLRCTCSWPPSQFDSFFPVIDSVMIRKLRIFVFDMITTYRKLVNIAAHQMVATSEYCRANNSMWFSLRNRKQSKTRTIILNCQDWIEVKSKRANTLNTRQK